MPNVIGRRDFLRLAGISGAAAAIGWAGASRSVAAARQMRRGAPSGSRALVVVEMGGGNDGFSMVPPVETEVLRRLRPSTLPATEALVDAGGDVAVHPGLARLAERGVIAVEGVGSTSPDGSHFEMLRRWWTGDVASTRHSTTGVLGRLCDVLDEGAPVTGLSIGGASSPALANVSAGTLGLPDPWLLWWLADPEDDWGRTYRDALAEMSRATDGDSPALALVRANLGGALDTGEVVSMLAAGDDHGGLAPPEGSLGSKLALAAQVLAADIGVRVIHVPFDGDFDTHENHTGTHDALMDELGAAVGWFADELARHGLADDVLVMTTSEFGRRPEENGSAGLDHGTASTLLVTGPVASARVGEPVDFSRLDDEGNVAVPISLDRYFGGVIEEWFAIPAGEVVDGEPLRLGIAAG